MTRLNKISIELFSMSNLIDCRHEKIGWTYLGSYKTVSFDFLRRLPDTFVFEGFSSFKKFSLNVILFNKKRSFLPTILYFCEVMRLSLWRRWWRSINGRETKYLIGHADESFCVFLFSPFIPLHFSLRLRCCCTRVCEDKTRQRRSYRRNEMGGKSSSRSQRDSSVHFHLMAITCVQSLPEKSLVLASSLLFYKERQQQQRISYF